MLMPEDEKKLSEKMRVVQVLYVAFLAAICIMTALPLSGALAVPLNPETPPVVFALFGVGAVNIAVSFFIPTLGKPKRPLAAKPELTPIFNQYLMLTIASVALRESVAIFGFVSFMLSGNPQWPMLFGGVAIVAMLLGWPKSEALRARLSQ